MNGERSELEVRAARHAALADPARLRMVDLLSLGDRSPKELQDALGIPSNLVAHHLGVLEREGMISRARSEGDRRRSYVRLAQDAFTGLGPSSAAAVRRVLFVCTGNSARSQLAAALWNQRSEIPATSAGTKPAERIAPQAIAAAGRRGLDLPDSAPRRLEDVADDTDYIVTVCDAAHELLAGADALHWSVPSPGRSGTDAAFDATVDELAERIEQLADRFAAA